jgi:CHAT domain-containing protein/Flp pilus assembly protein TadD
MIKKRRTDMKKIFWLLWFLSLGTLFASQATCDAESLKPQPQRTQLTKLCLPVAKQFEKAGEYSVASWYYLLAAKNKHNREVVTPKITWEDGNFANVAHSFVLAGDIQTASKLYGYFLYIAELKQANEGTKADYALLYKLYPQKKKYLQLGEKAWRNIYRKIEKNGAAIGENNAKLATLSAAHDHKGMIAVFEKQVTLYAESFGAEHPDVATLYANIGIAYNNLGDYTKALSYKRKGLALRQKILSSTDSRLADSYNDVGVSYQIIGNDKKAIVFLTKALAIREKNPKVKPEILSQLYSTIARSFSELKLLKKAAYYQKKSLALSVKSGDAFSQAYAHNNQGNLYFSKGKYNKAIQAFKESLTLRQKQKPTDTLALVQSYANLSLAYRQIKKYKRSLSYANKALKLSQALGEQSGLAQSYKDIGWIYFAKGDYLKAYDYARKAFERFMRMREEDFVLIDASDKEEYLKSRDDYIALLVESAYLSRKDLNMMVDTFNSWLRYKGSLFDSENMLSVAYRKTDNPRLKTAIKSLSDKKRSLAKLYQTRVSDRAMQRQRIKETETQIQKLTTELSTQVRGFDLLKKLKQVSDVEVVEGLSKDELYIDFARIAENYFIFIVNAEGQFHMQFINAKLTEKINRAIRAFRQNITRHKPTSQKRLSLLYNLLLQDILEDKRFRDKQRLILSLDGLLHLFPFEALYDKRAKKYLIESKDIRYIPNAREMIRLQSQTERKPNSNMVLFANPDYNAPATGEYIELNASRKLRLKMSFSALPGTKAEAEVIQKILTDRPITSYLRNHATEENLYQVKSPSILHIATHGFFTRGSTPNPMLNSAIALAGANYALTLGKNEGVVSALKLSGLDLEGTELVVLSACETGVMKENATDSISGLSKAFIQAGARDIMVSLWSVSDMGTKELMRLFYQSVKQHKRYSQALRLAKIQMIHNKAPLSIWAPFILNGI